MSWYFSSYRKSRAKQRQQIERALKEINDGKSCLDSMTAKDLTIDDKINVHQSITYISGCLFRPTGQVKDTIGQYFGIDEMNKLINSILGKQSKKFLSPSAGINSAQLKKRNEVTTDTDECCRRIEGSIGPINQKIMSDTLMASSVSLMERDFAEAILYSKYIMSLPTELPMSICNIHCATLYWWMHNADSKFRKTKVTSFNFTNEVKEFKAVHIEPGVTLRQFLDATFGSTKNGEIAYNYLLDATKHGVGVAMFNHFGKLLSVVDKQTKVEDSMANFLYDYFDSSYDDISDAYNQYQYEFLRNKKHRRKHVVSAVLLSSILDGITKSGYLVASSSGDAIPIYEYFNLKTKDLTKQYNKVKIYALDEYGKNSAINTMLTLFMCVAELNKSVESDHDRRTREIEHLTSQVEALKTKHSDMRKNFKEVKKSNDELQVNNKKLQSQLNGYKQLEEEGVTVKVIEGLRKEIEDKHNEIEKINGKNIELGRTVRRLENEIKAVEEKLDKQENEYLELLDKYDREKELSNKLSLSRAFSEIPTECFVNSIKDKRIVLIGGDMMFPKLQKMNFNNLKCIGAGSRNITTEDVIHADLIVIITAFVDHSTIASAVNAARTNKIKVLNFNNKNVDLLVLEIFKELNK